MAQIDVTALWQRNEAYCLAHDHPPPQFVERVLTQLPAVTIEILKVSDLRHDRSAIRGTIFQDLLQVFSLQRNLAKAWGDLVEQFVALLLGSGVCRQLSWLQEWAGVM